MLALLRTALVVSAPARGPAALDPRAFAWLFPLPLLALLLSGCGFNRIPTYEEAIKAGQPGDRFVASIEQCGAVLAEHFPPGGLDRDLLPDKLLELLTRVGSGSRELEHDA